MISQLLGWSEGRTEWHQFILKFVRLIFPKYVAVSENVRSTILMLRRHRARRCHSLDVIEIKPPFDDVLPSKTIPRQIRADHGFVGTIMQAEKHLFHVSKSGDAGDETPQ